MQAITHVPELLRQPKKIFITTHFKPDGDAIGSALGLFHFLRQRGHQVHVVVPSAIPDFLGWLPGIEEALNYESEPREADALLKQADLIFCLDFNQLGRVGPAMQPALENAVQPRILIDHHLLPDPDAFQFGISEPEKSSTCEMIYDFILLNNGQDEISSNIMQCLYTGIVTDTGAFRFPSAGASVHRIVADFKSRAFRHDLVHDEVYDTWTANRMRFLGFVLYEKMELFPDRQLSIIALSRREIETHKVQSGDTEGIVNYPLSIRGIRQSVLLTEQPDGVKLSFRSKGDIDVSSFAREHFEGGGHFNAAGGRTSVNLKLSLEKLKALLLAEPPKS